MHYCFVVIKSKVKNADWNVLDRVTTIEVININVVTDIFLDVSVPFPCLYVNIYKSLKAREIVQV